MRRWRRRILRTTAHTAPTINVLQAINVSTQIAHRNAWRLMK